MKIQKRRKHEYWILGVPSDVTECGPYSTRAEAESDLRGMRESFRKMESLSQEERNDSRGS